MSDIGSSEFAHNLEIGEAGLQAAAQLISAYYNALLREKLDTELVNDLVIDYAHLFHMRTLFNKSDEEDTTD